MVITKQGVAIQPCFHVSKTYAIYKTGNWVGFIKLGQKHASKDGIELAFAQQTSISTRGMRFDFRLAVLVLVLAVTYSGLVLAVRTSYFAAPDSRLLLVVVRDLSVTTTRHNSNKQSIHKYKLNSKNYKTNKDS